MRKLSLGLLVIGTILITTSLYSVITLPNDVTYSDHIIQYNKTGTGDIIVLQIKFIQHKENQLKIVFKYMSPPGELADVIIKKNNIWANNN